MNKNLLATLSLALLTTASFAAPIRQDGEMAKTQMGMEKMAMTSMTGKFRGVEAHSGMASLTKMKDGYHLKVSDDFMIPASPAPHWQVVDASGNTYLLQRFTIAGDKTHREIVLPKYVKSVAKVQVWCSFAEVLLGEASFSKAVMLK